MKLLYILYIYKDVLYELIILSFCMPKIITCSLDRRKKKSQIFLDKNVIFQSNMLWKSFLYVSIYYFSYIIIIGMFVIKKPKQLF